MFNIEEELKKLPLSPGVYMHKDSLGNVIYVGKAIKLRNRVSQYFHKSSQQSPKVRAMVDNIRLYYMCYGNGGTDFRVQSHQEVHAEV